MKVAAFPQCWIHKIATFLLHENSGHHIHEQHRQQLWNCNVPSYNRHTYSHYNKKNVSCDRSKIAEFLNYTVMNLQGAAHQAGSGLCSQTITCMLYNFEKSLVRRHYFVSKKHRLQWKCPAASITVQVSNKIVELFNGVHRSTLPNSMVGKRNDKRLWA